MPDIIIQALAEELHQVLSALYSPLLHVKMRQGDEKESNWKSSRWQTGLGLSGPSTEYATLKVVAAPVRRSLRDATLHHYNQFTMTVRCEGDEITVDENIEIDHNYVECAVTLTGISVMGGTEVPGPIFPHEDPSQFFRALTEIHSHVVVSAMTSGWPLIATIVPDVPKELVLKLLDCRYIRYCLKEDLGYEGVEKIDLGHFEYSRIYEQADYADDDIVRWPWNPITTQQSSTATQ